MVRAVRIHHREPLQPVTLRPGLGDVGDAAVEERALARQPRIDHVGALVPGAAPVGRRHHPSRLLQLLPELHVVEIAADGELPVAVRLDVAFHQHVGAAPRPRRVIGRGNLCEARLRQAVGAGRLEQAVVPEVGGDDPRQCPPERRGRSCRRAGRLVLVGGKGGDRDAEVLPLAFAGDRPGEHPVRARRGGTGRGSTGRGSTCGRAGGGCLLGRARRLILRECRERGEQDRERDQRGMTVHWLSFQSNVKRTRRHPA